MMERAEVWPSLRESPPLVLVNPTAGGRARAILPRIRKVFESLGISTQFVATNCAEELESAARHAISQNQRLLLAIGGDGTFQALANGVLGAEVIVGVLPVGGGNDFAAALGIPRDPLKATEAILRGRPRHADFWLERTPLTVGSVAMSAEVALGSMRKRHATPTVRIVISPAEFATSLQLSGR